MRHAYLNAEKLVFEITRQALRCRGPSELRAIKLLLIVLGALERLRIVRVGHLAHVVDDRAVKQQPRILKRRAWRETLHVVGERAAEVAKIRSGACVSAMRVIADIAENPGTDWRPIGKFNSKPLA